jgi:hypothetical protein
MDSRDEDLEDWGKYELEIDKDIKSLSAIVESDLCSGSFNEEELSIVQEKMTSLLSQSDFWLKRNNAKRFCYDLKKFLSWLRDYVEEIENDF